MAKREAASQLQKDRNELSESESPEPAVKASSEVLAKRKILKPRGRTFSPDVSGPKAFSGFGSAFSNSQPKPESAPSQPQAAFSFFASATKPSPSDDKNEKIKALNIKFIDTLTRLNTPGTVANFVPIAQKYISYYEKINQESTSTPQPTPSFGSQTAAAADTAIKPDSLPAKPEPVDSKSDSEEDSDDEVKIQGPQFTVTAKPSLKNTAFSFKPKPAKKPSSDSDSEDDIKIEGPKFTFNKEIKDPVFKFKKADTTTGSTFSFAPKPDEANAPKSAFSFGSGKPEEPKAAIEAEDSKSENKSEEPKSALFGAQDSKPAFSFGTSKPEEPKPAFSFGSNNPEEHKPFSFGSNKPEDSKPAFSFGSANKSDEAKPFAFGSGSKPSDSKPAFSFGSSNGNASVDNSKPAFSFNLKPEEKKEDNTESSEKKDAEPTKNLFSFSQPKTDEKPKPFSFNPPKQSETEPLTKEFSFSSSTNTPAFSFKSNDEGSTQGLFSKPETNATDAAPKPAFNFNFNSSSNEKATKPFSFDSSAKPFSFGSNSVTAKPFSNDSTAKPFSFGSSDSAAKPFSFGSNGTASAFGSAPSKDKEADPETVPEEETGGDFEPIVDLSKEKVDSTSTGEEGEEILYEKKAKLMLLDPSNKENPYTPKGLGELKVLKNKETSKSRILVRADGGLRVLLNTAISKDITYDTIGNGSLVRVPTIDPTDQSIKTYVLRVKTGADGEALLNSINEAKQ